MTAERWRQIEDLFHAAREHPPGERREFIEAAAAADPELRDEVLSLDASFEGSGEFLDIPPISRDPQSEVATESPPLSGRRIGAYRLEREISSGGMGTVYLAFRDDDQYRKQVAIKLIRPGLETDFVIKRFRTERQILAGLEHPNIARLLDGGASDDGRPYLVMEYVEGLPVDEYCKRNHLGVEDRLRLFQKICGAVHYAHQHLIIHRDLKPTNILVGSDGEPKLLDFGIAKLLDPVNAAEALAQTRTGVLLLTPLYASPEQLKGGNITTASDVYSLGVLLYELLTGQRPYTVDAAHAGRLAGAIAEGEPERPSAAITRGEGRTGAAVENEAAPVLEIGGEPLDRLRRRLQGDLDNIVLMAIRKDPQRRYGSAEQFSDDIRRHLEGLPVIARRDTLGYRSGKFLRRHLAATAAVSAVLLALVAGLIVTIRAERTANRERIKAQRISDFVQKMLGGADPTWNSPFRGRGRDLRVAEVLDASADRLGSELRDEPEVEAELRSTLGNTYRGLGLLDAADKQLQAALAVQVPALGDEAQATARTLYFLGDAKYSLGRYADAERFFRRSIPGLRKSHDDNLANAINDLGNVMVMLNREHEGESLYREALELSRAQNRKNDTRLGILLGNLGTCADSRGDIQMGLNYYRQALGVFLGLPGDPPMEIGVTYINMARLERVLGHLREAASDAASSLAIFRKYLAEPHPYIFVAIAEQARIRSLLGDPKGAEQAVRQAVDAQRKALGEHHVDVARLLTALGAILLDENEPRPAETVLREALEIRRKALQPGNTRIAETAGLLGRALATEGDYAAARTLLEESYQSLRATQGDSYPATAEVRQALAEVSLKARVLGNR